jgi:predicted RNA binding protein YcfA (HicA-like mRNA interferase family)
MSILVLLGLLEKDGWYEVRQKGSHRIFKHPVKNGIVVVPIHSKKDVPKGTLNAILKQAGLKP